MKRSLFFVFALLLTGSLMAQSDGSAKSKAPATKTQVGAKTNTTPNAQTAVTKGACCKVVIDVKSPTGDLETQVWDATPVNAKAGNPTSKSPACKELNFELVNSKGEAVKGWSVCDNAKCPPSAAGQAANQKQGVRQNRKTVDGTALTATTPVIDATTLTPDDYTLRARCGTQVSERKFTVKRAGSGLDSSKAGKAPVKKSGN